MRRTCGILGTTCLLLLGVLHRLGEVCERIAHLSGRDVGRGVLEGLQCDPGQLDVMTPSCQAGA